MNVRHRTPWTPWLKLASADDCEMAVRVGALLAIASVVCKVVGLLVFSFSVKVPESSVLVLVLADCMLLSVLAVLLLRKSRAAATALVVYLVSSWIVLWAFGALPNGWVFQVAAALVALVLALYGSLAVLATFRWPELQRTTPC